MTIAHRRRRGLLAIAALSLFLAVGAAAAPTVLYGTHHGTATSAATADEYYDM